MKTSILILLLSIFMIDNARAQSYEGMASWVNCHTRPIPDSLAKLTEGLFHTNSQIVVISFDHLTRGKKQVTIKRRKFWFNKKTYYQRYIRRFVEENELDSSISLPMAIDSISLDSLQIIQLEKILLGYESIDNKVVAAMCYNPHHAIIWINQEGKVEAFLEICFECNRNRWDSAHHTLGRLCLTQYKELISFFEEIRITYALEDEQTDGF